MVDRIDKARRSALMGRIRAKNTSPELAVRRAAHAAGLRFRLHRKDLPGRPDLVFPRYRLVVFVHGCFWHRHQGCPKCTDPKTNAEFWSAKLAANVERDARIEQELRSLGWRVEIIWECETRTPGSLVERLKAMTR
ncbi:very short patch repair endonuclease [Microvirga roseola]|uniref:very short patch repair endonuclease n=1 Tax=Microvirga roseola TaxID=2883126 RepID=UPI001E5A03A4|nr:DNA mismatch endonuclease Vsr [Microvirga roseola]